MIKQEYNSNFKMKISRSLTDLQNSLDEACRLGLPPHFDNPVTNPFDQYNKNFNAKTDATQNLEKMIFNKERTLQHSQVLMHPAPYQNSTFLSHIADRGSNNSVNMAHHRERYLNVLRSLADDHRSEKVMQRSRSHDTLIDLGTRVRDEVNEGALVDDLKREVRMLRQRLVAMDDEIGRLKSEECVRTDVSGGELCEELRRKVETYRSREEALLGQLHEAVATIEEAKHEEMQAVMQSEKAKEDLKNVERRYKEYVEESMRKMGNQSEGMEKEIQAAIRRVMVERDQARSEIDEKFVECRTLRDQLKSAQCEIDRLSTSLQRLDADKNASEQILEAAVARAAMQRDEVVAQSQRLRVALDKERSERISERTAFGEEVADLRRRLTVAENNEANAAQDRMILLREAEDAKVEMGKLKQAVITERRREQEEMEGKEREWDKRLRKLTDELCKKESHFESVIRDADEVMTSQGMMIERLKTELASTVKDMDGWAEKNREEKEELRWRVSRMSEEIMEGQGKARDLQEVVEEQGRLVESVRRKCQDLEADKERNDAEILSLMTVRNGLMRTVELLQAHLTEFRRRVGDCVCGVFDCGEQLINAKLLEQVVAATV